MNTITEEMRTELTGRIIPFWRGLRDDEHGGYAGTVSFDLTRHPEADRGCIQNSRILWFFSEAYRTLGDAELLDEADHAFAMLQKMTDEERGGVYWSLHPDCSPADTVKHTYCHAFAVYGLSAYRAASGSGEALERAKDLFRIMETRCRDEDGYLEAFTTDWQPAENRQTSGNGVRATRTMNTLLHVMEACTALYRVWPGIDQLNTEKEALMVEGSIPIARFLASFADLNGEREVFTEFSDHSVRERGQTAPISCYYDSVNWHLAMGVNNFTSYYSWAGIDDEACREFNRYTARSGWLLRQGIRDSRAAVFYPEAAMWASYTPSTAPRAIDNSEKTRKIDIAFARSMWALLHNQIDFDCIDRKIAAESEIRDGKLVWGDRQYGAVVLPCARVIEKDAIEKLLSANDAGVRVIFCEEPPAMLRETGRESEETEEIARRIADGRMSLSPAADFTDHLCAVLPDECRSIRVIGDGSSALLAHVRTTEDGGKIVFLTNMGKEDFSGDLRVFGSWERVLSADAGSGQILPADWTESDNPVPSLRLCLEPGKAVLFILN